MVYYLVLVGGGVVVAEVTSVPSLPRCKYTTFEPPLSSILTIIFSKLFRKAGVVYA